MFAERNGDEAFDVFGRAVVPLPREDEARWRFDFAILAGEAAEAVLLVADHAAIAAADAEIDLGVWAVKTFRPHPILEVNRIAPQHEQQRGGRIEVARDEQFVVCERSAHLRVSFFFSVAM